MKSIDILMRFRGKKICKCCNDDLQRWYCFSVGLANLILVLQLAAIILRDPKRKTNFDHH